NRFSDCRSFTASVLRAIGDSKTPLKAMTAASVTNIVLDCIAVFVLDWGIAGAAIATVIAQCLSALICWIKMRRTSVLRFDRSHMEAETAISRNLIALGAPITLKIAIIALGGMIIQSVVNSFDMAFIAGFTASNKLFGLLEIAAMSYGFAITTYVGQNYGAGLHDRISQGIKEGLVLSVLTSLLIGGVMLIFGRDITMLFLSSDSAELIAKAGDVAYLYLAAMSLSLPALYVLYVYQSALQGIGNTVATMISGGLEFCVRLTGSVIVTITGYANGIFAAEVAAWFCAAAFLTISFYHHFKRTTSE
ncbi:MAG: polysaccharide biosynthesis C-terminal domain-containing protein, partial [Oscillospiraceae bacterium]|nr:polysaccharide biosynthesis C-terminal domain-containing protein [Oscillospiraceae bacterium]